MSGAPQIVSNGIDRKDRNPSPTDSNSSRGNVVDHNAANGEYSPSLPLTPISTRF